MKIICWKCQGTRWQWVDFVSKNSRKRPIQLTAACRPKNRIAGLLCTNTWSNYPEAKYFDPTFSRNERNGGRLPAWTRDQTTPITWFNYPKAKYFDPTFSRNERSDDRLPAWTREQTTPITWSNYSKAKYFDPIFLRKFNYTLKHASIPNATSKDFLTGSKAKSNQNWKLKLKINL